MRDSGLVLLSCRAFMACCCFSRAASMSPRSSSTELLLFFPAALVKASCQAQKQEDKDAVTPTSREEREVTSGCAAFKFAPAASSVPC